MLKCTVYFRFVIIQRYHNTVSYLHVAHANRRRHYKHGPYFVRRLTSRLCQTVSLDGRWGSVRRHSTLPWVGVHMFQLIPSCYVSYWNEVLAVFPFRPWTHVTANKHVVWVKRADRKWPVTVVGQTRSVCYEKAARSCICGRTGLSDRHQWYSGGQNLRCLTVNHILRAIRTSEVRAMRTIFVENLCIDCVNNTQSRWKRHLVWDVMLCRLENSHGLKKGPSAFETSVTIHHSTQHNIREDFHFSRTAVGT